MEILRKENGVYMTPYTKEQFGLICNFASECNLPMTHRSLNENIIDEIYEVLTNEAQRGGNTSDSIQFVTENIELDDIKKFILSYAEYEVSIDATRQVIEFQSCSITDIPDDLDLDDWDAVHSFAEDYAMEIGSEFQTDDEDCQSLDDANLRVSIGTYHLLRVLNIGYENVSQIVEETA